MDKKYKPRSGLLALVGVLIMIAGALLYYIEAPNFSLIALVSNSAPFGFGLAMVSLTLLFYSLEGKIQRLEKMLDQKKR